VCFQRKTDKLKRGKKMSEKVLGFRKKDALSPCVCHYKILKAKCLVPVVSVEWLKKWCKENQFDLSSPSIDVKDLLKAIKKEVRK
jgi:hypothetical protein